MDIADATSVTQDRPEQFTHIWMTHSETDRVKDVQLTVSRRPYYMNQTTPHRTIHGTLYNVTSV